MNEYIKYAIMVVLIMAIYQASATKNHEAQMNAILDLNQAVLLYKATPEELRDAVRQVQQDCECQNK